MVGPETLVVRLQWRPRQASENRERFQVLKVRAGKIAAIADYETRGAAMKFAKRQSAGRA